MGCIWLFKVKCNTFGEVENYKVQVVMKGYTQFERDNFNETFSPIVKMTIVRYLLTTLVAKG